MKFNIVVTTLVFLLICMKPAMSAQKPRLSDADLIPINVQLKWYHQFQFAGYYAAIKEGYFKDAGLKVNLIEGGPSINTVDSVINGTADFGVGNSSLLIDFNNGAPIIMVSAIFQHSPFIIITKRNGSINSLHDLEGKKLMVETHSAELITYLKHAGVDLTKVEMVPHTGSVSNLAEGDPLDISALTAFNSTEPYVASTLDIPYQIFNPRDLNINFYADTLFTSQKLATQSPEIVTAMRDALNKGWDYASTHKDELISHILEQYTPRAEFDRVALNYESQIVSNLLEKDIVDIGYMSVLRWDSIAENFIKAKLLSENYTLDGFMFEVDDTVPVWASKTFIGTLLILLLCITIIVYIITLNKKLNASLVKLTQQSKKLELANIKLLGLSNTDALTGLANRRRFDEALKHELSRAQRTNQPITLLLIDVDFFKKYNDFYGHQAGDECLTKIANSFQETASRSSDLIARYGGEEFVIITSGLFMSESNLFAKKICKAIADLNIEHQQSPHSIVTISIGVASDIPTSETTVEELINSADKNLYRAKGNGRNTIS